MEETKYILDLMGDIIEEYNMSEGSCEVHRMTNIEKLGNHYVIQHASQDDTFIIDTYCNVNTKKYLTDMNKFVERLKSMDYYVRVSRHNEIKINPHFKGEKAGVVFDLEITFN